MNSEIYGLKDVEKESHVPAGDDEVVRANWLRYEYGMNRGHRDYVGEARILDGFFHGGGVDSNGNLKPGGQWRAEDLEALREERRPAYEFNDIKPAVLAAVGYQINNRADISFRPRSSSATDDAARLRSQVAMQIADNCRLPWSETEVFLDGMVKRAGYFDCRMDFEDSILGELRIGSLDPEDVIPDPDSRSYDPAQWADVIIRRWLSLDEIEMFYGREARNAVRENDIRGGDDYYVGLGDNSPPAGFGDAQTSDHSDAKIDRVLVIDRQVRVLTMCDVAIIGTDVRILSGDEPDSLIAHLNDVGAIFTQRRMRRVRWIVSTQRTLLHNEWSPYDRLTVVPFFPYFMRGTRRSMVDAGIGAQQALNKGMSQMIHIINSTANSGWQYEEGQLSHMMVEHLEQYGAASGLLIERKPGTPPLSKIQPNQIPQGVANIITTANDMLKSVTVPDAMRGNRFGDESGVAIQSRQHASQQILAVPLDSLSRTRNMVAGWIDYAISKYYDSERVMRISRRDSYGREKSEVITINQYDSEQDAWVNDLTAGEYDVVVTNAPVSVTYENSQYMQAIEMREKGIGLSDETIIRMSNLADRHEIADRMTQPAAPQEAPADPVETAKAELIAAQAAKTQAETVNKLVEGMFSASQTAANIATNPNVAPLADKLLRSAGFSDQDAPPIVPQADSFDVGDALPPESNTNPLTPANPPLPDSPVEGVRDGIEGGEQEHSDFFNREDEV